MAQEKLSEILAEENSVLDSILEFQAKLYSIVKEKDWASLEKTMAQMNILASRFSALDVKRDEIVAAGYELSAEEKNLLLELRSRFLKSKVENQALNTYLEAMQNFVRGVLENAVPQRRNVLYSREGKILKTEPESVVLNKVL